MVLIKGAMLEADRDNEDLRITLEVFSLSPLINRKTCCYHKDSNRFYLNYSIITSRHYLKGASRHPERFALFLNI
jgi:hypothetical protein